MAKYQMPTEYRQVTILATDKEVPEWQWQNGFALNLGAGNKHINGTVELDLPSWDADKQDIPYSDGAVSTIYAIHFLEHIKYPIRILRECQRVLKPGGLLNVVVPYYSSQIAIHDLDHKSFWCEDTWKHLFNNPYYEKEHGNWEFEIGANFIFSLAERNTMLITQLIRR